MSRRVFFSFHYARDVVRASQVRNSWVTQDRTVAGFWDAAAWEQVRRGGDSAVRAWIDRQLDGTSVTVVLIGAETASREYVLHEIRRSRVLGKGLLGVRIDRLRNFQGNADWPGANPFDQIPLNGPWGATLSATYRTYDYVADDGYNNMNRWIEEAARAAGRQLE